MFFLHRCRWVYVIVLSVLFVRFNPVVAQTNTDMIEKHVSGLVNAIASGKIIENCNFELFSSSGVIYSQAGYLDTTQPLTQERYTHLMQSPPLFGALLYIHRSYFAGEWVFNVDYAKTSEYVTVVGRNQENSVEIVLCKTYCSIPEYVIDIDKCRYNGTLFPVLLGFECKATNNPEQLIPIRLPDDKLTEVIKVISQ